MIYLTMMWEFFKTGLLAVGGGLATLPFLSNMANRYGWFTQEELANMLAVSESTPGPIGINMSTYVGSTLGGVFGGVLTTFSLVLPSYLVIICIQKFLQRFQDNQYVQNTMSVLRPASVGMVSAAILGVFQTSVLHMPTLTALQLDLTVVLPSLLIFFALLAVHLKFKKIHPLLILGLGALAGILFKL